jgi:hypothetical protein
MQDLTQEEKQAFLDRAIKRAKSRLREARDVVAELEAELEELQLVQVGREERKRPSEFDQVIKEREAEIAAERLASLGDYELLR